MNAFNFSPSPCGRGARFPPSSASAFDPCVHCGEPAPAGRRFCCPGCAAAFEIIQTLGLGRYYAQRILDPALRAPRPETTERWDLSRYVATRADGAHELSLAVDGLQCGACVWLIESVLAREPIVQQGRVNMTTRRLRLVWRGATEQADTLVGLVERLGYRLIPFDPASLSAVQDETGAGAGACSRGGRLRRGQRDADVDRHLGRRGRRTAARHGSGERATCCTGSRR